MPRSVCRLLDEARRRSAVSVGCVWHERNLLNRGIFDPNEIRSRIRTFPDPRGQCLVDTIVQEGTFAPGESPALALKPFFVDIYDKCGVERPEWLDEGMRTR